MREAGLGRARGWRLPPARRKAPPARPARPAMCGDARPGLSGERRRRAERVRGASGRFAGRGRRRPLRTSPRPLGRAWLALGRGGPHRHVVSPSNCFPGRSGKVSVSSLSASRGEGRWGDDVRPARGVRGPLRCFVAPPVCSEP